jgi:tetratricopeptide (TPR) repeat protein
MSDSLRPDRRPVPDAASEADRDAKVEQLLLVGLDHYFAAQYEQAINVWTRALFLDRNHARARAYIERARSALAERQRESEELLQSGVAAFERGEGSEARRLLEAALEGGAPSDEALAVLERLNRLEAPATDHNRVRSRREPLPAAAQPNQRSSRRGVAVASTLVVVVAVAIAVYAMVVADPADWRANLGLPTASGSGSPPLAANADLPLPRRGEMALARARALAAAGHLADALVTLDMVRPTDSQRADADRLRSDIQRQLLALTSTPPGAGEPAKGDRRGQ